MIRIGSKRHGFVNDAVKRLMAEGRVQMDGDGCYRVAYAGVVENQTADFLPAGDDHSLGAFSGDRNGKGDIAEQLLNK